jgi:plasmid stabilization system protein ParE
MIVRILDSALEDLDRGRKFYERQGEGLGVYFLDSLLSEIDSLVLFGGIHRKVFGYHRLLAKRFPYAIYYKVEGERVAIVWRVLDLRQAPSKIRRALE